MTVTNAFHYMFESCNEILIAFQYMLESCNKILVYE